MEKVQPLFVQSFLGRGILSEEQALELYQKSCQLAQVETPIRFEEFIRLVNRSIFNIKLEFRRAVDPNLESKSWALVNTAVDDIAKMATDLSNGEIALVKKLIDVMINTIEFEISTTEALKHSQIGNMTKTEAETFIDRLVKRQWFRMHQGKLSFGHRAILELQTYLNDTYGDVLTDCGICKNIVTTAYERCDVAECTAKVHLACRERLSNTYKECFSCQTRWIPGQDSAFKQERQSELELRET